ncbi:cytochrome P450 [Streptomyces sp. E-15]
MSDLPFLDVTAPGFTWAGPAVAAAREECWAARTPIGLMVLRYADVVELLTDPRFVPDMTRLVRRAGAGDGHLHDASTLMLQSRDRPGHRRVRSGLVNRQFSASRVATVRPFLQAMVQGLVDDLAVAGMCDFVEDFADPLAVSVICHLLAIPAEDYDRVSRWSKDSTLIFALDYDPGLLDVVARSLAGLTDYAAALIRDRVADPGADDVLSHLLRARDGGGLDDGELRTLVVQLLAAGYNTAHQLSHAMVAFARHPEQWALLRDRPELLEQAVYEVLRWCPTVEVIGAPRTVTDDLVHEGVLLPRGTSVYLGVHSAHRDARVFPDGDTFDITRASGPQLLVFGGGPHHCPGALLGRSEIAEALAGLTARLEHPRIAGPITWRPPIGDTGPHTLPLRFG